MNAAVIHGWGWGIVAMVWTWGFILGLSAGAKSHR